MSTPVVVADRVKETTTTTGTGAVSLLGAVQGFRTFLAGVGNGNPCYYLIADQSGPNWEVGVGTYTPASHSLSRTTVLSSSNGGALVNFTAGTKDVSVNLPALATLHIGTAQIAADSNFALRIDSPDTASNGTRFNVTEAAFFNPASTRNNQVVCLGWNIHAGGGREVGGAETASAIQFEQFFSPSAGTTLMETHCYFVGTNNAQIRVWSFAFDRSTLNVTGSMTHDKLSYLDRATGSQYANFTKDKVIWGQSGAACQHVFNTNNARVLVQLNAAGDGFIELMRVDNNNQVVLDPAGSGVKIGTGATPKIGHYGATPVVQPSTTGTTQQTVAGSGAAVKTDSTTTGGTGSTAYTVADVVLALKNLGLLKA
jgi:hypothetical protein